jgi:hypothetical protein
MSCQHIKDIYVYIKKTIWCCSKTNEVQKNRLKCNSIWFLWWVLQHKRNTIRKKDKFANRGKKTKTAPCCVGIKGWYLFFASVFRRALDCVSRYYSHGAESGVAGGRQGEHGAGQTQRHESSFAHGEQNQKKKGGFLRVGVMYSGRSSCIFSNKPELLYM